MMQRMCHNCLSLVLHINCNTCKQGCVQHDLLGGLHPATALTTESYRAMRFLCLLASTSYKIAELLFIRKRVWTYSVLLALIVAKFSDFFLNVIGWYAF